jgi:hypothetical protein
MTSFWLNISDRNATKVAGMEDINERILWFNIGMESKQFTIAANIPVLQSQKKDDQASNVACISEESAHRTPSSINASRTLEST